MASPRWESPAAVVAGRTGVAAYRPVVVVGSHAPALQPAVPARSAPASDHRVFGLLLAHLVGDAVVWRGPTSPAPRVRRRPVARARRHVLLRGDRDDARDCPSAR